MFEVEASDFQRNSRRLFGHGFYSPKMQELRELFRNTKRAYLFRRGSGGAKAANKYATAKYVGTRGDDLKIVVAQNADDSARFDVLLYLDTVRVDSQTVLTAADLTDNDFVIWVKDATLELTAGLALSGGVAPVLTNGDYQNYLDLIEGYAFNAIGCPSDDPVVNGLFAAFTKRMRDEQGVKFQCVTYRCPADHEGVVNVSNSVTDAKPYSAVYWVTGMMAGTAVNQSALNKRYDGELSLDVGFTQRQLEAAIRNGEFVFHRVGTEIRVLADINSLVTTTAEKGDDFKQNQTIRVIDQIANDIAVLFSTKYLGSIPNDADGRVSLWSDIVSHHEELQTIRAIEEFSGEDVTVQQGDTKQAVVVTDAITVVNAMAQLYMTVTVA